MAISRTSDERDLVGLSASNGFYVTAYVYAEPKYVDPPAVTSSPGIGVPRNGRVTVTYGLALGGHEDHSLVSWSICEDAACSKARELAVSRGDQPLRTVSLLPGFAGKFMRVAVRPKIEISEAGEAVYATSETPFAASAIPSANVSLQPRSLGDER